MNHKLQMSAGAERGHARLGVRQHTLAAVYDAQDRGHVVSVDQGQSSRLWTNVCRAYLPVNWRAFGGSSFSFQFSLRGLSPLSSARRPAAILQRRSAATLFHPSNNVPAKFADARHFPNALNQVRVPPQRQSSLKDLEPCSLNRGKRLPR